MTQEQIELLKRTVARDTTDDEFALYMTVASRLGLDPFLRQIHCVKRWDPEAERKVMAIQVGIDGYRLGATRTGEDDGQEGPFWCGRDGAWRDVWLDAEPPRAAKVLAWRKGRARPYIGIAHWDAYVQTKKNGEPNAMWRKHPAGQLAKCAEALALRKAYPAELAGTHMEDELGSDAIDVEFTEIKQPASPPAAAGPGSAGTAPSPSSVSQSVPAAAPAVAPPAAAAKPPSGPQLTEDDVIDIIEEMSRCGTRAALKDVFVRRINPAQMSEEQRARLVKAHSGQLEEIKHAEAAKAKS